jgi:hypothetical protein
MKKLILLFVIAFCFILFAYSEDTPKQKTDDGAVLEIDLSQYVPGKTYTIYTETGKIKELSLLNTYAFYKYNVQHRAYSAPKPLDNIKLATISFGKTPQDLEDIEEIDLVLLERLGIDLRKLVNKKCEVFLNLASIEDKYINLSKVDSNIEELNAPLRIEIKEIYSSAAKIYNDLKINDKTDSLIPWLDKQCAGTDKAIITSIKKAIEKKPELEKYIKGTSILMIENAFKNAKAIYETHYRNWSIGIDLNENDYARFIIERSSDQQPDAKGAKWEFIVDTAKQKGYWLTSFGFAFMTPTFSKEYDYYCKKQQDDEGFTIASDEKQFAINFSAVPSIYFTYLSSNYRHKIVNFGFSAGLGLKDNIAVFIAGTMNIYTNISIHLGLGIHGIDRLLPKYKEQNLILKESLDSSQLVKSELGASIFISVSYKFASNPFSES